MKTRVRVYANGGQITGECRGFSIGNDGAWVDLAECDPGPPLQSLSLDHVKLIRPEDEIPFAEKFVSTT